MITAAQMQIHPAVGVPPTLSFVAPSDLHIDASYQRTLEARTSVQLVRRMAGNWDWRLCQPIQVARRADGSLYIVDGQHRHAAAVLRGDISFLPCVITDFANSALEADAFVRINRERRSLNSVDVFKADLAAGKAQAVEVAKLIEDAGLTIAPHSNYTVWKPGMIYCVPGVASAYRRAGREVTSAGLVALQEAFSGQVLRYAGRILRALFRFYERHVKDAAFDPDLFLERLERHTQEQWIRKGAERIALTGEGEIVALTNALEDAYRDAGGPGSFATPVAEATPNLDEIAEKCRTDLIWCDQCDMRVKPEDVVVCKSAFCKAR